MAGGDADHLSRLIADQKTQALSIAASGCIAVVIVEAILDRLDFIRGEVVPGLYPRVHIVRP